MEQQPQKRVKSYIPSPESDGECCERLAAVSAHHDPDRCKHEQSCRLPRQLNLQQPNKLGACCLDLIQLEKRKHVVRLSGGIKTLAHRLVQGSQISHDRSLQVAERHAEKQQGDGRALPGRRDGPPRAASSPATRACGRCLHGARAPGRSLGRHPPHRAAAARRADRRATPSAHDAATSR